MKKHIAFLTLVPLVWLFACNSYDEHYGKARTAIEKGKFELAAKEATKAISQDPQKAEAYNIRGVSYLNLDKPEDAKMDFQSAVSLDSSNYKPFYNLGRIAIDEKDFHKAHDLISIAIRLDSLESDLYNNRGIANFSLSKNESAIRDFDRAILLDSGSALAYSNRAKVYKLQNRLENAISDYEKSLEISPGNDINMYILGLTYLENNKPEKGCEWLSKAVKSGNKDAEKPYSSMCR